MGYRCEVCREEITGNTEVWRDRYGVLIDWKDGTVPPDPAPFHPQCQKPPHSGSIPERDKVSFHGAPVPWDPPQQTKKQKEEAPRSKDSFSINNLPKPKQLSMFDDGEEK